MRPGPKSVPPSSLPGWFSIAKVQPFRNFNFTMKRSSPWGARKVWSAWWSFWVDNGERFRWSVNMKMLNERFSRQYSIAMRAMILIWPERMRCGVGFEQERWRWMTSKPMCSFVAHSWVLRRRRKWCWTAMQAWMENWPLPRWVNQWGFFLLRGYWSEEKHSDKSLWCSSACGRDCWGWRWFGSGNGDSSRWRRRRRWAVSSADAESRWWRRKHHCGLWTGSRRCLTRGHGVGCGLQCVWRCTEKACGKAEASRVLATQWKRLSESVEGPRRQTWQRRPMGAWWDQEPSSTDTPRSNYELVLSHLRAKRSLESWMSSSRFGKWSSFVYGISQCSNANISDSGWAHRQPCGSVPAVGILHTPGGWTFPGCPLAGKNGEKAEWQGNAGQSWGRIAEVIWWSFWVVCNFVSTT